MVQAVLQNSLACMLLATAAASVGTATAGEYNPVLSVGDAAPVWEKLPGTDGKAHSLADLKAKDVVVVVFTCNSCPVATDYEDRLIAFAKKHAGPDGKTAVVAINVNQIEEDALPAMTARAKEKGYPFPYLYDATQQIAKDFGAGYTPEWFVFDKARKLVYMGAMDDNTFPEKVQKRHVEEAVAAALAGKLPETKETVPIGCRIRFEKKRRTKPE